ncbi:MAG: SDR family NAD(P)-dependent oxidoreductase [Flavobacteriaceae bacterium]|nr:SDR family NAD(P)-dependent oxidoreductase [Bacteroidia bacterium]NNL16275.1 SDR family NAD(P)-dependent oxidoreductase [Flavobacteriaceae bacterium]
MKTHFTLITGASKGFGKSMTLELAKKGMNLVLIALPDSGLKELSKFIEVNFNVKVFYLETDLSKIDSYYEIYDFVENNKINIKYLINNAGILSRGMFEDMNDNFVIDQVEVNVLAPTVLIKLLLPNLKENAPAGILNISSMAAFFSLPKKQVYCGSKAYLLSFSKCLGKELKKDRISVTTICPGGLNTTTKICYQNRILGFLGRKSTLTPEHAAKIALDGMFHGKKVVVPGLINKFFRALDKILPEFIEDKLTNGEIKKLEATS